MSGHHTDLPTWQVNTASPLPESYIIPTGIYSTVELLYGYCEPFLVPFFKILDFFSIDIAVI